MRKVVGLFGCLLLGLALITMIGCGRTGGSSGGGVSVSTASLSGQVAIASGDLLAAGVTSLSTSKPQFRTLANSVLSGATVAVQKIATDGSVTNTNLSATTNAQGEFVVNNVPVLTDGSIYKLVATKNNIEVTRLTAVTETASKTANIAPETTVAAAMLENVIKEKNGNSLTINDNAYEMANGLVINDTEQYINHNKVDLPSNLTTKKTQIQMFAEGLAEDKQSNCNSAFKKILLENNAAAAIASHNQTGVEKYINDVITSGSGSSARLSQKTTQVLAKACLDGETKTVSQVTAALSAGLNTQLNASTVASAWSQNITNTFALVDSLISGGAASQLVSGPAFFIFNEVTTPSASTVLDVPKIIALEEFAKAAYSSGSFEEMKFLNTLGFNLGSSGASTTEAFFENIEVYYGNYGGWKTAGSANIYVPQSYQLAGITPETVELIYGGSSVATFPFNSLANQNIYRFQLGHSSGHPIAVSNAGITYNYTLKATFSNLASIETPVTIEGFEIPAPSLYDFTWNPIDDSSAPIGSTNFLEYYKLPAVAPSKPVFIWSSAETSSITLPPGFSWGYWVEIGLYAATLETHTGIPTLEINNNNTYLDWQFVPDTTRATLEYTSGTDPAKLLTNNLFISPISLLEEYGGNKVAYRFYVQRVMLNAEGKFNGIAAGVFNKLRYAP